MTKRLTLLVVLLLGACGGKTEAPVAPPDDGSADAAIHDVGGEAPAPTDAGPDCQCRNLPPIVGPLCPPDIELTQCPKPDQ
jgi:hypothetical protein